MLIAGRNYNGVWSDISSINIKVKNSIWKSPIAYSYLYINNNYNNLFIL